MASILVQFLLMLASSTRLLSWMTKVGKLVGLSSLISWFRKLLASKGVDAVKAGLRSGGAAFLKKEGVPAVTSSGMIYVAKLLGKTVSEHKVLTTGLATAAATAVLTTKLTSTASDGREETIDPPTAVEDINTSSKVSVRDFATKALESAKAMDYSNYYDMDGMVDGHSLSEFMAEKELIEEAYHDKVVPLLLRLHISDMKALILLRDFIRMDSDLVYALEVFERGKR